MLTTLSTSIFSVFLAEIGDKTQLLALFLAIRYPKKAAIIWGMIIATLINHFASAWFGSYLQLWLSHDSINRIIGISFILLGLWLLIPDKDTDTGEKYMKYSAFMTTFILFSLAELGDKTQVATVLLAVKFNSIWLVALGSSLGLLLANIPVVFFGSQLINHIPMKTIRLVACVLFCILGAVTLNMSII